MKILLAEDDKNIANSLKKNFREDNIELDIAVDGNIALMLLSVNTYDAILLDWRMPEIEGIEVLKSMRKNGNETPVILLTAMLDISNKIEALNLGADDYITKPFSYPEVLARINAVLRRGNKNSQEVVFKRMRLNLVAQKLYIDDIQIILTRKEFELLNYFIKKKGVILSKAELCRVIWDYDFVPGSNIVESAIKNLRRKIEEHCNKKIIKNIYGEGYIFIEE